MILSNGDDFIKEIELVDRFCKYLSSMHIDYKREVRKGGHHTDGYVDVVIKDQGFLIGIEAKINGITDVIRQASSNRLRFPMSYILVLKISPRSIEKCKERGLGIILPKDQNSFFVYQKPSFMSSQIWSKNMYFKILRNWIQNRIGRVLSADSKELPINYDSEKLESINPTYDWVNKSYDPYSIDWNALGFKVYPKKSFIERYDTKKRKYIKEKNHSLFEYL